MGSKHKILPKEEDTKNVKFFFVIMRLLYVVIQGRTTTRTVLIVKFLACNVRLCSNTVLLHELCDTTCIQIISVLRKTKASSKLLSPPLLSYNCPLNKLNHSSNSPMLKGLENLEDEILSSLSVWC